MKNQSLRKHTKKIDVLFINPPSPDGFIYIRDINRHGRSSWERMKWPQTSLAYLAAITKNEGYSVDIVDCIAEDVQWPALKRIMHNLKPKICISNIISVTYSNDLSALQLAKDVSNALTIGMGPHLTSAPERSLFESEEIDIIIRNEAEITLQEFLRLYKTKKVNSNSLRDIKGIAYIPGRFDQNASEQYIITPQREFIKDLDSLPRPLHELLPLHKYWGPLIGHYTFVEASRGCAFKCVFCRQAVMWQWQFRSRSGQEIANEAIYVNSLGVENILFHADTFTLDHQMVHDLCDRLIEAKTPFRWACNAHVKTILGKNNLINKMKKAGCWMIAIGIESGNNEILSNIKKNITIEEAESVAHMINNAGIEAWGYFVLGLPGETTSTLKDTINASLRLPLTIAKFDIAAPYPGTEFYNDVIRKGYLEIDKYEDFDQNASSVVEYPQLSRNRIKSAARRANMLFYLRKKQMLRMLKEIKDISTFKAIFCIIRDQIRLLSKGKRFRKDATKTMYGRQ